MEAIEVDEESTKTVVVEPRELDAAAAGLLVTVVVVIDAASPAVKVLDRTEELEPWDAEDEVIV